MVVRLDDIVVDTKSKYDVVTEAKEARENKNDMYDVVEEAQIIA